MKRKSGLEKSENEKPIEGTRHKPAKGSRPGWTIFDTLDRNWLNIGVAWEHKEGGGFTLQFQVLPRDLRYVVLKKNP